MHTPAQDSATRRARGPFVWILASSPLWIAITAMGGCQGLFLQTPDDVLITGCPAEDVPVQRPVSLKYLVQAVVLGSYNSRVKSVRVTTEGIAADVDLNEGRFGGSVVITPTEEGVLRVTIAVDLEIVFIATNQTVTRTLVNSCEMTVVAAGTGDTPPDVDPPQVEIDPEPYISLKSIHGIDAVPAELFGMDADILCAIVAGEGTAVQKIETGEIPEDADFSEPGGAIFFGGLAMSVLLPEDDGSAPRVAIISYGLSGLFTRNYLPDIGQFELSRNLTPGKSITHFSPIQDPEDDTLSIGGWSTNFTDNLLDRLEAISGGESLQLALNIDKAIPGPADASGKLVCATQFGDQLLAVTEGVPGELWRIEPSAVDPQWSRIMTVGDTGNSVPDIKCREYDDGSGTCAFGVFGADEVIVTDCTADGECSLTETFSVGDGPLGLDMRRAGDSTLIAVTCFNDNSLYLITLAPEGTSLQSLVMDNCNSPSDVTFLADGNLAVACNGDGTYTYVALSRFGGE